MHSIKPIIDRKQLKFIDITTDQAKVVFPSIYSSKQVASVLYKLISSCKLKGYLTVKIRLDEVFLYMNYGSDFSEYLERIQNYIENRSRTRQQQEGHDAYEEQLHQKITETVNISTQPVPQLTQEQLTVIASHQEYWMSLDMITQNLQLLFRFGLTTKDILNLDGQNKNTGWLGATATCIRVVMDNRYHTQFNHQEIVYFLLQGKMGRTQLLASCMPVSGCPITGDTLNNEEGPTLADCLINEILKEIDNNPLSLQEEITLWPDLSVQQDAPCPASPMSSALLSQKRPYLAIAPKYKEIGNKRPKMTGLDNNEVTCPVRPTPYAPRTLLQPNTTLTFSATDIQTNTLPVERQNSSHDYLTLNTNRFFGPVLSSPPLIRPELEQITATNIP